MVCQFLNTRNTASHIKPLTKEKRKGRREERGRLKGREGRKCPQGS